METKISVKSLEFLNTNLVYLYDRKHHYVDIGKDFGEFKNYFTGYLQSLERVYKNVYLSDISLDISKIDVEIFKRQYPALYEKIGNKSYTIYHKDETKEVINGISYITWLVERIRNINMHAVTNVKECEFLVDPNFIKEFPLISDNVKYVNDGVLTIMGMIVIIFSLLDEKSSWVEKYSFANVFASNWGKFVWKEDGDGAYENYKYYFAEYFKTHFKNDFEIDIRKEEEHNTDILHAIFGNQYSNTNIIVESDKAYFDIDLANTRVLHYGCHGILKRQDDGILLIVRKGSYWGAYFENDYVLKIKNEQAFIDIACKVPPFMLVAYLYLLGKDFYDISELTEYQTTMLLKLNKPKFYKNKGLTILLALKTEADIREVGKTLSEKLLCLFLSLEEKILFVENVKLYSGYSKLSQLLKKLDCPEILLNKLIILRNFSAHAYLLNEYVANQYAYKVTVDFIFETIQEFLEFLENKYHGQSEFDYFTFFRKRANLYLWNNCIGLKYKRIFANSINLFDRIKVQKDLQKQINDLVLNFGAVDNSVITPEIEEKYFVGKYYSFRYHHKEIPSIKETQITFRELTRIKLLFDSDFEIYNVKCTKKELNLLKSNRKYEREITIDGMPVKFELTKECQKGIVVEKTYKVSKE